MNGPAPILLKARREVTLLEAVLNTTTRTDRWLLFLATYPTNYAGSDRYDGGLTVAKIRTEFHRLRRKKGRPL